MARYQARTLSPSLQKGVVFSIAGETFTVGDILDIHTAAGTSLAARITRFDMSGLQLSIGDKTFISGPWKAGDQPFHRDEAMTSTWTVQ